MLSYFIWALVQHPIAKAKVWCYINLNQKRPAYGLVGPFLSCKSIKKKYTLKRLTVTW